MRSVPSALILLAAMLGIAASLLSATDLAPSGPVVISEVSYNPPPGLGPDTALEFVEVTNRGAETLDLSGWRLKDSDEDATFVLPAGAMVPAGGYLVLARNAAALRAVYGAALDGSAIAGDFTFALGNDGDTVRLLDAEGRLIDQVSYDDDLPWPIEADAQGSTLERLSLQSDASDFSNFAASTAAPRPGSPGAPSSRAGEVPRRHDVVINELQYNPVRNPDASPRRHCPGEEFVELQNRGVEAVDLSGWRFLDGVELTFPAGTLLAPGAYLVLYKDRAAFEAKYGAVPNALGPYGLDLDDGGESVLLVDAEGRPADFVDYNDSAPWPVNPDGLRGSLELIDPRSDNERGQAWAESDDFRGTPGRKNSATLRFEAAGGNAPPQITRVSAFPVADPERLEVRSSDAVRVEARIADRHGVAQARIEVQLCPAGDYIPFDHPRYATDWTSADMSYDPERAVHFATLPAQPHRTLVRYRIVALDGGLDGVPGSALEARSPRPSDPEPNYAYFVHDGVPDYVADQRSAFGPPGHVHTDLERVPVYHLLGRAQDIEELLYRRFSNEDSIYRWRVSLVHDGHVHDHLRIRLRSGHRYSWPKRPFRVRFNKGNYFDGRFFDGTPYPRRRRAMILNTAQHDPGKPRGESGVFESLGWRLYREAGVIGAFTNFVHLRIVRSQEEHGQFTGDFFGIYLELHPIDTTALQDQPEPRPTDEAASLYKMNGFPEKKHPDCDPSTADVDAFIAAYQRPQSREWFAANLDVERYLAFRAVTELSDNHDMDSLKNFFYYFNTSSERWEVSPWDLDNTFGATASGDEPLSGRVPPLFRIEYRNRFRRLWQLLYDEQRLFPLIDEWSAFIRPLADADLDRWDTEPREACPAWPQTSGGNCRQYLPFSQRMRNLKLWIRNRTGATQAFFRDEEVPATPLNLSPEDQSPVSVPVVLRTSAFSDPNAGDSHAQSLWLLIERSGDWAFPLWELTSSEALQAVTVPTQVTETGREYLFRAAHADATGRWSFLSEPTSFVVGLQDLSAPSVPRDLRVEHAGSRAVAMSWTASTDGGSGVAGYRVLRDGAPLGRGLVRAARFTDHAPSPRATHRYEVIAVNGAGLASAPSQALDVDVPALESLGGWRLPASGFDYLYDARPGEDAYSANRGDPAAACLDGTWWRSRVDEWDGGRPGDGGSAPGGAGVEEVEDGENGGSASVLSLEDPGAAAAFLPPPANQRLFLLHTLGDENLLDAGVTLLARLRIDPAPASLPAPSGQSPEPNTLRGQLGVGYRSATMRVRFSLWLDAGRLWIAGGPSVPIETETFHSLWTTIEREGGGHRVRVYIDGALSPAVDEVVVLPTGGTESSYSGVYLELGLANLDAAGAIEVDYVGFLRGVRAPVGPEGAPFRRGDLDGDGSSRLEDAVAVLGYLFLGDRGLECPDAADADDSGRLEVTDAVYLLNFVFRGGRAPAAPFPGCGEDATSDELLECAGSACLE
jgi:hypothetical protein